MTSPRIRAWVFSDLHQEHSQNAWDPAAHAPAGGFDVAVVAGDVHMPLTRSLEWLAERLPGVPAIYTPGNHDSWWNGGEDRYTIYDQIERGRERAAALGIHLLLDDTVVIDGTRFLGGTLWTDFRLGSFGLTHAFRTAQGRYGMMDYRRIRTGPRSRNRIEPGQVLAMHQATRAFIGAELARPYAGPTVVVTHHAPHPASLPDPNADLNWCYASDLTELIVENGPELWIHGHVHQATDYVVGRTRVICNPRGHADESCGFEPARVVCLTR
ncbi:metallophosphoesterase [Methylobacterium aerolatum]|uniref:3',5'-cyclic AMP phosphodiesterase CpdA n=1 Tax=Methylobacterium aerolatum TaxID=418708 RepID=A0ABU0I0K6_9HYPH|nr:metallophosphoesterase [Methylobacterium aerolatum]MDQ0448129.1 3',5'-cyclic AMP phosphodiesterase CpdA [Methylobacterium aerolatum]GJD34003.1 3',5'-cyclic adenosine monophosphate phosphodiesterase CpdA [Methylobacterium aerolatum]